MQDPIIVCPACLHEIRLTESLAAPLLEATRKDYELRLETTRKQITAEEQRRLQQTFGEDMEAKARELAELKSILQERDTKLAAAQQAQAEVIRRQRELDDAKRELDLTVEKRIQEGLASVRAQARTEAEDHLKLRLTEKEHVIAAMQKQIEELKRRSEQGSQQLQGEAQELALEAMLRTRFTTDDIIPVAKGEHGGDVLHTVRTPAGLPCGTLLWEAKRTKHWSDNWLGKLREDQRAAKADIAIIVSHALPAGVESFDNIDHVWVVHPRVTLPVAAALRQSLLELASARQALQGQQTKMEQVYQYLTGPRFRLRIQAIVEAFTTMQADLDRERKVLTRQWAKRAEQIECVMQASVGLYGDLQGIAGQSLQEIEGLELTALEDKSAS